MSAKPVKESASFTIKNGDVAVTFKVQGSAVTAIVEAFNWLAPERRLKLLERLQATQAKLLALEAERATEQTGQPT